MTTKEYLMQIRRMEKMIDNKLSELYRLRQLVSSISISTDGERIMSSGSMDKMGDSVAKIVDLENCVAETISRYTELRQKIIAQIDSLKDYGHYSVLFSRYVLNNEFGKIADEMGYSERQVLRIHGSALKEFEKMFGKEYLSRDVIECHA